MAKKKRASKGSVPASKHHESVNLPSFDENALSALTATIEKGFKQQDPEVNASKVPKTSHGARDQVRTKPGPPHHPDKSKYKSTSKPPPLIARGVKRDAHGNAKSTPKGELGNADTGTSRKKAKSAENDRDVLLQEILALGGTAEDLDLVADAASDNEDGEYGMSTLVDTSFQRDLARFVQGLGIDQTIESAHGDAFGEFEDALEDEWEASELGSSGSSDVSLLEDEASANRPAPISQETQSPSDLNRLIFPAQPDWHSVTLPALPIPEVDDVSRYAEAITNLKEYALSLLESDSNLYASKHLSSSSSHRFLSTIMSSGTLTDKVSALTLVVQESPVHTTKSFENLLALAKKRSRGQAVTALGALKDLLGAGVVLPTERRLRTFTAQPGLIGTLQLSSISTWKSGQNLPGGITKAHLISWAYEDWLKTAYFDMLKILEGWCSDEVEYARSRAVTYVYELLKEKPEQEANLLRLLVNKLGDPDKKIASRTSYLLLQLQISHPLMKQVIISSIESELLLRPGQSLHAKYYAINTLNQTILSVREETVVKKLLDIYFELFVTLLKKTGATKLLDAPTLNRKGQIQGGGGLGGKKATAKATREEQSKLAIEETTEKMISAVLTGVNRAFPFSKADDLSLEKHMDTLFRITHSSNFNTSIQALMLIEQLASSKHIAVDRFYRTLYESLFDPRLIASSKHALYLNLLFRALNSDINMRRVKAFTKRLLQVLNLHQPPFICGVIFLLRELESTMPGLRTLYNEPEDAGEVDLETFHDIPEDGEPPISKEATTPSQHESYDGRKRDPEYSNADKSCLWESIPFLVHFHPSVCLFADRLLSSEKMPPKPDLASHGLTSFLDRFVYRNAKAGVGSSRGGSIMQPLSSEESKGVLLSNKSVGTSQEPLNTEAFWRKKADDVAADEVFFHRYFNQIGKTKRASAKKPTKVSGELGIEEDENEDEIWQALVDSRPELEGASDDESDMEMLDLNDSVVGSSENLSESDRDDIDIDDNESILADSDSHQDVSEDGGDADDSDGLDELFTKELQTGQLEGVEKDSVETNRQKKRRMKGLPTFASAEDYAEMLENDEDEDF